MTLLEYIKASDEEEITVLDKDYDVEVYFYQDILEPKDEWDKAMQKIASVLTVTTIHTESVECNIAEVIEDNLDGVRSLFDSYDVDIDNIMDGIESIISGNVSEEWMTKFADGLVNN